MSTGTKYCFRLYIAGRSTNSALAMDNLQALCRKYLPDNHEIEVIDLLIEPMRALTDGILVTPTLIKTSPPPARTIIGNLSQTETVIAALGLSKETQ